MWVNQPSDDLGSNLAEEPASKKRKVGYWPGWMVKKQGVWPGFELINVGGGLEWLQASIGSEFWTYHDGKHFYMKVTKGIRPASWQEVTVKNMPYNVTDDDLREFVVVPQVVPPYVVSSAFT